MVEVQQILMRRVFPNQEFRTVVASTQATARPPARPCPRKVLISNFNLVAVSLFNAFRHITATTCFNCWHQRYQSDH
jgi:hypothetical protein